MIRLAGSIRRKLLFCQISQEKVKAPALSDQSREGTAAAAAVGQRVLVSLFPKNSPITVQEQEWKLCLADSSSSF